MQHVLPLPYATSRSTKDSVFGISNMLMLSHSGIVLEKSELFFYKRVKQCLRSNKIYSQFTTSNNRTKIEKYHNTQIKHSNV